MLTLSAWPGLMSCHLSGAVEPCDSARPGPSHRVPWDLPVCRAWWERGVGAETEPRLWAKGR